MKRLHFALSLFAALACSGLKAQTVVRANIPFEFQMGKTSFPSGDYTIEYSTRMLLVRQEAGSQSAAMALAVPVARATRPDTSVLEFHRYGDSYFVSGIFMAGLREGTGLPQGSHEKELARRTTPIQTEAIVLQTK
jgi:hypothetical protein